MLHSMLYSGQIRLQNVQKDLRFAKELNRSLLSNEARWDTQVSEGVAQVGRKWGPQRASLGMRHMQWYSP